MRPATIALAALLAVACSTTQLTSSWRDDSYTGPTLRKLLVIGVGADPRNRRIFEEEFVAQVADRGAQGAVAYRMFPGDERLDRATVEAGIAGQGFDGVVVVSVEGRRVEIAQVPETVEVRRSPGWYGYYSSEWEATRRGGYVTTYEIVTLEANVFHVESGDLLWSGTFDTQVEASVNETIRSFVRSAIRTLRDAGLLD